MPHSSLVSSDLSSSSNTPPARPNIPARSPLRPAPQARTTSSARKQQPVHVVPVLPEVQSTDPMPLLRHRSLGSFSTLLESLTTHSETSTAVEDPIVKPLVQKPVRKSDSPITLSPIDIETISISDSETSSLLPPTVTAAVTQTPLSKRTHALLELLSSERAYASDLALIRAVHIPLALGQRTSFSASLPLGTSSSFSSSGSSTRTLSMCSSSSSGSTPSPSKHPPPVSRHRSKPSSGSTAGSIFSGSTSATHAASTPMSHDDVRTISSSNPPPSLQATSISPTLREPTASQHTAPMSPDDVKIIFGNIIELAEFSDVLCERLEEALGDVLEDGKGEDRVGKLFLEIIPQLEPPFKSYITKHPLALSHYHSLLSSSSSSPALLNYLTQIQTLTSSLTHAWDIPSLLIKPVQRLLKYPLLLQAIYEETPGEHGDRFRLKLAKERMEEVARKVNEGRRRWEVVRDVLNGPVTGSSTANGSGKGGKGEGEGKAGKKRKGSTSVGVPIGVAASVSLGRMKSLTRKGSKNGEPATEGQAHAEAEAVSALEKDLKALDDFIHDFAKHAKEWAASVKNLHVSLLAWSMSFGGVIGAVAKEGRSEAFDAYLAVVREHLIPSCEALEKMIDDQLLVSLSRLAASMQAPHRLLAAMHTLSPLHNALLHNTFSASSRPPPALLEASNSYVALRGQLAEELPAYLGLLEKGVRGCVGVFVGWQGRLWADVREKWDILWKALMVPGEELQGVKVDADGVKIEKGGWMDTEMTWKDRMGDVERKALRLNITAPPPKMARDRDSVASYGEGKVKEKVKMASMMLASLQPSHPSLSPTTPESPCSYLNLSDGEERDSISESLERAYKHAFEMGYRLSGGSPTAAAFSPANGRRPKTSGGSNGYDYFASSNGNGGGRGLGRGASAESMRSGKSAKSVVSGRSRRSESSARPSTILTDEFSEIMSALRPSNGTKSKSIPIPRRMSSDDRVPSPIPSPYLPAGIAYETLQKTGRASPSRRPSFRRKWSDTIRPTSSRRSPSPSPSLSQIPTVPALYSRSASLPMASQSTSRLVNSCTPNKQSELPLHSLAPALYACRVVHRCDPPDQVVYLKLPFFTLRPGIVLDILHEAGHPSSHPDLPLFVDDGEDCLLLVRDRENLQMGWALASFLTPVR